jgi:cobaltochelatase CobS
MARTPSRTPADIEGDLGARGATRIDSGNRALAQVWLIASGVPSITAKSLTVGALDAAYNDTGNRELAKLRSAAVPTAAIEQEPTEPPQAPVILSGLPLPPANVVRAQTYPEPPPMPQPAPTPQPTGNASQAAAAKLADALAAISALTPQQASPLDEARVLELIAQEAPKHAPKPETVEHVITIQAAVAAPPVTLSKAPRHSIFPRALRAIGARENVMLVGPAGSGKTTIAEQIASALSLDFYMTGAVDSPYKLTGFRDAQGAYAPTAFRRAFEHGGLFLFDEIDASAPAALLSFNAALANGYADFPDGMVKRHEAFRVIAAANTYGAGRDRQYVGRNQLDAASRDRFIYLPMDYDPDLERTLAGTDALALAWCAYVQAVRASARLLKILHVVSPRATLQGLALLRAGEALADTIDSVVWRGLEAEQASKITGQDAVARELRNVTAAIALASQKVAA